MTLLTKELIRNNRKHLNSTPEWLAPEVYRQSRYRYGIPLHAWPLLNRPIDNSPTYTDLLVAVALEFGRPTNILEIGVSVGKNLYCLAKALKDSTFFVLDWESPNPLWDKWFTREIHSPEPFITFRADSNCIHYVCGDEFDPSTWQPLAGQQFDIIFSDGYHHPRALLTEYKMLSSLDLLNLRQFFMMWDDLTDRDEAPMNRAFVEICNRLRHRVGPSRLKSGLLKLNGWLGQHEYSHVVGVATTLDLSIRDLADTIEEVCTSTV